MRHTISWLVTVASGSTDIVVRISGSNETVTIPAGDYRGWGTQSGGAPDTDTLAYALQTAIEAHTGCDTCTVTYDYSDPTGSPRLDIQVVGLAANQAGDGILWTDGSTTFQARDLGCDTAADLLWGTGGQVYTPHNGAGYWCPGASGSLSVPGQTRNRYGVGGVAISEHSPVDGASSSRSWGYGHRVALTWPYVEAAYVYRHRAADSTFAGRAGRDVDDPNNTVEGLYAATSSGDDVEMRCHYADGDTRDDGDGGGTWFGILIQDWDMAAAISDAGDGLGSYGVTLSALLVRST